MFLFTCNEKKAESIEIKVMVGKETINSVVSSITSRKLISNKIDEMGIKKIFGMIKDINITKHFERNILSSE